MAIPPSGTFDYTVVVPDDPMSGRPWAVSSRAGREDPEDSFAGASPFLRITDAGPTPNAGWYRGRWLPSVQRAGIVLSASRRTFGFEPAPAFHVDRVFVAVLRPGDTVNLSRTGSGGIGVSVIRGGTLLAAAGAVANVPLGGDFSARYPRELLRRAEDMIRAADPHFHFAHQPIEFRTGAERRICYRGTVDMGPYRVFMEHGFYRGLPGTDECVAITRSRAFSDTAASSTAQLLDNAFLEAVDR